MTVAREVAIARLRPREVELLDELDAEITGLEAALASGERAAIAAAARAVGVCAAHLATAMRIRGTS